MAELNYVEQLERPPRTVAQYVERLRFLGMAERAIFIVLDDVPKEALARAESVRRRNDALVEKFRAILFHG